MSDALESPAGLAAPRPTDVVATQTLPPLSGPLHNQQPPVFVMPQRPFTFDGGAGSYFVMSLLAFLVIVFTLGIALPWAVVMKYRWRCEHTYIDGQQLRFTGSGSRLFGQWIKWLLLI